MTGTEHFAAIEDVIKSFSGKLISSMTDIEPDLRQLGANVRNLGEMKSWEYEGSRAQESKRRYDLWRQVGDKQRQRSGQTGRAFSCGLSRLDRTCAIPRPQRHCIRKP